MIGILLACAAPAPEDSGLRADTATSATTDTWGSDTWDSWDTYDSTSTSEYYAPDPLDACLADGGRLSYLTLLYYLPADAIAAGANVFASVRASTVTVFALEDGVNVDRWEADLPGTHGVELAIDDATGLVYVADDASQLHAFDLETGELLASVDTGLPLDTVVVAGGRAAAGGGGELGSWVAPDGAWTPVAVPLDGVTALRGGSALYVGGRVAGDPVLLALDPAAPEAPLARWEGSDATILDVLAGGAHVALLTEHRAVRPGEDDTTRVTVLESGALGEEWSSEPSEQALARLDAAAGNETIGAIGESVLGTFRWDDPASVDPERLTGGWIDIAAGSQSFLVLELGGWIREWGCLTW